MTVQLDGQLDLLELLGDAAPLEETPVAGGPGAVVLFHVRVGVVREGGSRYLTTANRCGLCGSKVLSSVGSGSYCGTQENGDHWMLQHCGRCEERHIRYRSLEKLIRECTFQLRVHDDPGDCDNCDRIAAGSWISCGAHERGPLFDTHVCSVCGRTFKGSRDPAGMHGYGPVAAAHCSEACSRPAYEMVQARYAELIGTTKETS